MMSQAMMDVRVARKATEAPDICTFELVSASGGSLPPFSAGSHIDVEVTPGLVRQYSLCNDPSEPQQKLDLPAVLASPEEHTHLYVCGPGGFLDFVVSTAKAIGWAESNIHFEYFSAKVIAGDGDGSFAVKIASTGQVVQIAKDC